MRSDLSKISAGAVFLKNSELFPSSTYADPIASPQGRKASICVRLRIPVEPFPLKNFETFVEGGVVYAAIVTSAGAVFLEDRKELFPSDTFIAQLRLLLP